MDKNIEQSSVLKENLKVYLKQVNRGKQTKQISQEIKSKQIKSDSKLFWVLNLPPLFVHE